MEIQISCKIKELEEYNSNIEYCERRLFDGICDPFEESLFKVEQEKFEKQILKSREQANILLKEIRELFKEKYENSIPKQLEKVVLDNINIIKIINLNPNILSLSVEDLDIIFNCDNINNFSSILLCNSLIENKDCIKALVEKIKNKTINQYFFREEDVVIMERILSINSKFDKEFLFLAFKSGNCVKNYLKQNMSNEKILDDIYSIYSKNKVVILKLLGIDVDITYYNNLFFRTFDTDLEKMKIFLLANISNSEIVDNYMEKYSYVYLIRRIGSDEELYELTKSFDMRIAMLSAKTVEHQNKLFLFLKETKIDVIDDKYPYHYLFPLSEIGNIDLNDFGNYRMLFKNMNIDSNNYEIQKQQILNIFENVKENYFYFYDDKNELKKIPITFYKQFLNNVFFGGYLSQCMYDDGNSENMPFYDEEIIGNYAIDGNLKKTAIRTIELGIGKSVDYDITNEIIWNQLFYEARYNQEEFSKQKIYKI